MERMTKNPLPDKGIAKIAKQMNMDYAEAIVSSPVLQTSITSQKYQTRLASNFTNVEPFLLSKAS